MITVIVADAITKADWIVISIQAITALGVLGSVFVAMRSAEHARRAAAANERAVIASLYHEFLREYSSPDMAVSLKELAGFVEMCNKIDRNFVDVWFHNRLTTQKKVDDARRHVKSYFIDAAKLHKLRVIDKDLLGAIVNRGGTELFRKVIVPMHERMGMSAQDKDLFDLVLKCTSVENEHDKSN